MASLKTEGFSLSAMPRGQNIPANAGAVDVKAIYDGVREGLAAFETVRRAPASMVLADAEMAAKTAEAPLGTRKILAETEGIEAQTPLKTAILAGDADPATIAAKRAALIAKAVKPLTGTPYLLHRMDELRAALIEKPTDATLTQAISETQALLNKASATSPADPNAANVARVDIAKINANAAPKSGRAALVRELINQGYDDDVIEKVILKDSANTAADPEADRKAKAEAERMKMTSREGIASSDRASREKMTIATNQARIEAAKASVQGRASNKAYDEGLKANQKVQEELVALARLEDAASDYINSAMGAGVVAGSAPVIAVRSIFGDDTGKNFQAAISQSMKSAVETMRGLGAMSEREFEAAMSQLPKTNEPDSAILAKMDYLKHVRQWVAARNSMYLDELASGKNQIQAGQAVIKTLPMPTMDGPVSTAIAGGQTATAAPAAAAFSTPADAEAAAAAGTIKSGDKITVGGVPGTWK